MIHLHDIIGMKITDFESERMRLNTLFSKTRFYESCYSRVTTTLKDMSEDAFRSSNFRGTSVDIDDLFNRCEPYWRKPSLEGLLLYCEVVFNIAICADNSIKHCGDAVDIQNQLCSNIVKILEKTGYDLQKGEDGIYFVIQKNAMATDVVHELNDRHLALAILEYNRFSMKGEIERKRELLNVIGRAVEPILKDATAKARSPEVFDDVRFALNRLNIRHNNVAGANEQPTLKKLSKEELETAYDDLYSSMLVLIKISQLKEGHARMDALKKQMTKA